MKKLTLSIFLLFGSLISYSQIKAKTEEGKYVLLSEDGTWKYIEFKQSEIKSDLNCSELLEINTDKMTGNKSIELKKNLLISEDGKIGFNIYIFKSKTTIALSIKAFGSGNCIDDDAKMNILYQDNTRDETNGNQKFNCENTFTLYMGGVFGKEELLDNLKTKLIKSLRIWTTKDFVQQDFKNEQANKFINIIRCLSNN